MPIDTKTLKGTGPPKTLDGRTYPAFLRTFERYDDALLGKLAELGEPTLNKLALAADTPKMRSAVSPWLASAEWRGLIARVNGDEMVGKRRYKLTPRGKRLLGS